MDEKVVGHAYAFVVDSGALAMAYGSIKICGPYPSIYTYPLPVA